MLKEIDFNSLRLFFKESIVSFYAIFRWKGMDFLHSAWTMSSRVMIEESNGELLRFCLLKWSMDKPSLSGFISRDNASKVRNYSGTFE